MKEVVCVFILFFNFVFSECHSQVILENSSMTEERFKAKAFILMELLLDSKHDSLISYLDKTARVDMESNESMLRFFDQALEKRKGIIGYHEIGELVYFEGDDKPIRSLLFHFNDGMPGSISFTNLDPSTITNLSLFVTSAICPNGQTLNCPLITVKSEQP